MHRDRLPPAALRALTLTLAFALTLALATALGGCGKESHHDDPPEAPQETTPDPEKTATDTLGGTVSGGANVIESASAYISTVSDQFAGSDSTPFQAPTSVFHGSFTIPISLSQTLHLQYLFESIPIEVVPVDEAGRMQLEVLAYARNADEILKFANSSVINDNPGQDSGTDAGADLSLKLGNPSFTCARGYLQNSIVAVRGICLESMKIRVPRDAVGSLRIFVNGISQDRKPMNYTELWNETEALSEDTNAYHKRGLFKTFVERSARKRELSVRQLVDLLYTVPSEGNRLDLVRIFSGHVVDPRNADRVLKAFRENPDLGIDAVLALSR